MKMTEEAMESQREYQRPYRSRNRNRINATKRAGKVNLRASWEDYGIDEQRLKELMDIAKSGEYAEIVMDAALKADRKSAGHILLSMIEGTSYDHLEFHEKLGRCPLGKSSFYGARRLAFYYLNEALKAEW